MSTPSTDLCLEAPYDSSTINDAISTLEFDRPDWLRIFNVQCGPYSERRKHFRETPEEQILLLADGIYDDDPCVTSADLAFRIDGLPALFKYAILEVNDRFWTRLEVPVSFDQIMLKIGVVLDPSNHERIAREARRTNLIAMS